jgi:hypothetical protein
VKILEKLLTNWMQWQVKKPRGIYPRVASILQWKKINKVKGYGGSCL